MKNNFNLLFTITNWQIVRSRSLIHRVNHKFVCLSACWERKLANEYARISALIVKLTLIGMSNIKEGRYKLRLHVSVNLFAEIQSPSCATLPYTPSRNTASHDDLEKINSWVPFHFLYEYGAPMKAAVSAVLQITWDFSHCKASWLHLPAMLEF